MAKLVPLQIEHCHVCGLPPEFCEYNTEVPHPAAGTPAPKADAASADQAVEIRLGDLSVSGERPAALAPGSAVRALSCRCLPWWP
jgi:hypothetical protein